MSQTTLEERKVPMPFSVNDLGETYELKALLNAFFGGSGCTADLWNMAYEDLDTGKITESKLGYVSFDYVSAEEYTNDCKISYVARMDDLSIQGIQEGVSIDLVYDTWGNPDEIINDVLYYYGDERCSKTIIIYSDENNCVDQMNVDFKFEKEGT